MSGVVGRVGRGFGVLAGVVVCVVVAGCSSAGSAGQSVGGQSAHVRMSGDYVLNDDGTLRKPHVMPTVPTLDERAALQFNETGATLAAYHFVELVEYAWASGDTQPLQEYSEERCSFCQSTIEQVRSFHEQDGWVFGMKLMVTERKTIAPIDETTPEGSAYPNSYGVSQIVETSSFDSYSSGRLTHNPSSRSTMELFIHWTGDEWRVAAGKVSSETDE